MTETPYRAMVAGVAAMPPVVLRGVDYTGAYLSTMLAINPEHPAAESGRTSQLIAEFGRLVAAALRDKEMAEARYRVWRDTQIMRITTESGFAKEQGLAKVASQATAENWLHTVPDYLMHQEAIAQATEVWGTLHAAFTAAQARAKAVFAFDRQGGSDQRHREAAATPRSDDGGGPANVYTGGSSPEESEDIGAQERGLEMARTPVPPIVGPPPPPPGKPAKAPPPLPSTK